MNHYADPTSTLRLNLDEVEEAITRVTAYPAEAVPAQLANHMRASLILLDQYFAVRAVSQSDARYFACPAPQVFSLMVAHGTAMVFLLAHHTYLAFA